MLEEEVQEHRDECYQCHPLKLTGARKGFWISFESLLRIDRPL